VFRRIVLKNAYNRRKMFEELLESVPLLKSLNVLHYRFLDTPATHSLCLCLSVCLSVCLSLSLSLPFNGHFPRETGLAGFIGAKDDADGGGDNCS